MKLHEWACYIKADRWDEFLEKQEQFGFVPHPVYVYPKYIVRNLEDGRQLRIGISEPVINMWDNEDKNGQREVWLFSKDGRFGHGDKNVILPHIKDLIAAGFVDDGDAQ